MNKRNIMAAIIASGLAGRGDADSIAIESLEIVDAIIKRVTPKSTTDADEWIPHRAGDPMPVGGEVMVEIKCLDGYSDSCFASYYGPEEDDVCWWTGVNIHSPGNQIFAYRLLPPVTQPSPGTPS